MPTLATVLEEMEQDITEILMGALTSDTFGPLSCVFIGAPAEGITAKSLPFAVLAIPSVTSTEDEDGVICSESARVHLEIYLQAAKPKAGRTVEGEKRLRAQTIRSAMKAGAIRHAAQVLWQSDTYQEQEDFEVATLSDAYVLRVSYQLYVEWED